ncbi:hypothetical protein BDN71DRAFT_1453937 [Pleurotus eryngii]|uniref:Uncharacterized protein n=1 Tax=Pleurotus eryngii TaxID=5323 RepID=A0A9P6D4H3_PLEER|nr:hypothetical protein BDN71DRAFT_1453937 [Pleurotus eryngii]
MAWYRRTWFKFEHRSRYGSHGIRTGLRPSFRASSTWGWTSLLVLNVTPKFVPRPTSAFGLHLCFLPTPKIPSRDRHPSSISSRLTSVLLLKAREFYRCSYSWRFIYFQVVAYPSMKGDCVSEHRKEVKYRTSVCLLAKCILDLFYRPS